MLHITDGQSVAGTLRQAEIPGDVSTYGDLLYEGPAPAGLTAETWRDTRARFMADAGYATLEEAQQYLKACDDALDGFLQYDEVVIWLDHRLSNQLILIKLLDWFSRQNLGAIKLSLICVGRYPGRNPFVGLGELTAGQLASLADTRLRVTDPQFRLAQAAWNAFTSPDPTSIERLLACASSKNNRAPARTFPGPQSPIPGPCAASHRLSHPTPSEAALASDTSPLPFLAAAFRRHLEQFPSVQEGLSRTEHQAMAILREQGALSPRHLFRAVQDQEEQIFMGHASFDRIVNNLSVGPHPLVQISGALPDGIHRVAITEAGRNVMEGGADHIEWNGIDQWLGGVHLSGKADWRWDRLSARLVTC